MGTKKLSKEEFMALATNHYYKRKHEEAEKARQADYYIIGRLASKRDLRLRKRGF